MPGGIGSVNQRPAVPARASQGRGAPTAGSSSTSRGLAGRVEPPRPAPNRRVPGRFDDNPAINDRRGRLARSYSAYGSFMIVPNGQPMAQGGVPAPNEGVRRYFGR
jgi:hypothetical protein